MTRAGLVGVRSVLRLERGRSYRVRVVPATSISRFAGAPLTDPLSPEQRRSSTSDSGNTEPRRITEDDMLDTDESLEKARDRNELSGTVIGACIEVHRHLGPGLLEAMYEDCLCEELGLRGIPFDRQVSVPVHYKGRQLGARYRIDLMADKRIVIELKSVETLLPVHRAQVLTQ